MADDQKADEPKKPAKSIKERLTRMGMGRPPGSPNKTTTSVKAALEEAFEKMGGVGALVEWGSKEVNRAEFYKLWAKLLPKDITLSGGLTLEQLVANAGKVDDEKPGA